MTGRRQGPGAALDRALIGANVRAARERAGLSRWALAAEVYGLGVASLYEGALARVEHGHRDLLLTEAAALARALGIRVETLVEGTTVGAGL